MLIEAYIDGASRGNPGPAGVGVVIVSGGREVRRIKKYLGRATNNEAEYRALLEALKAAGELGACSVVVYSDSELLVRQLNGEYRVRSPRLVSLYGMVMHEASKFREFKLLHVPREKNREADRLANEAIDEATC